MADWLPKYYCNYCQEHITDVRIKCAECQDFDLCLQCFHCGAETGCHKSSHKYQLIDSCSFQVFQSSCQQWKAREELILLDSVEHYGYGNWEDPQKALDKSKAIDEVKQHFEDYYIQGSIGKATWSKEPLFIAKDHTVVKTGPLSPSLQNRSEVDASFEKTELGYMPRRDDFEWEFENEAESLVSTLTTANDDEDIDTELKLAQIDMYMRVLKERQRRKCVVRNHNLVNQFYSLANKQKTPNGKKKSSRDEKDIREKFQPFAQFQSSAELDQHIESLRQEKELRIRIKELIRYRRNGLTKLKECVDFDSARYKRDRRKENYRKKPFSVYIGQQPNFASKILNGHKIPRRKRRKRARSRLFSGRKTKRK